MPKFKEEKADDKQISTILFKHVHVIYIYDIYICAFNGVLYLHWACIQQVMYMDVDDRVFVPLSDVYIGNMPLCMSFVTPEDLSMRLDVCRFMTSEDLEHVPRRMSFYDIGGLRTCASTYVVL
ncbi:hypothetical protein Taro_008116 [Colocasia esculenta]|uniref:Uncharacterized protein n=1 Tax=Colocasia esculenta TaxID=4460 RepID=A0A843U614_COLES|nr:hypothetical protein [Colocasia esculenta]